MRISIAEPANDDLCIVCSADKKSICIIQNVIKKFGEATGLKPNLTKSSYFFAGIPEVLEDSLSVVIGIPKASLPVKYLGIPLSTRHVSAKDCRPLIDKIKSKIDGWRSKHGQTEGNGAYKVKWKTVVLPKKEGGLGVKSIAEWNKVCMSQHVLNICRNKEAMWIRWINAYRLKGKPIWDVQPRSVDTWTWKEMLKLRALLRPHVQRRVGNGLNVNFLHDNWHSMGLLCDRLSKREVNLLRIEDEDSVSSALTKIHWPRGRHAASVTHICKRDMPLLNSSADVVCWNGAQNFKSSNVWNTIRCRGRSPPWYKLVWFKGVHRFAFIMWLLCNGKLQTKDKLYQWSIVDNTKCMLYDGDESAEHLFFSCDFSSQIWRKMLSYTNNFHIPGTWNQELDKILADGVGNEFQRRLMKLVLSCAVYSIWSERNQSLFQ
ncbi:reverse transcriptase [Lithospermum erythrorhizon]|uniref:Reverse transcriptase n=1 Tax=Lithospermum erythrorhizon TaxID=34254 RepID=A0AAV3QV39_LITER